eukprot:scaffold15553_cov129-Isochrysis_galbana.AAC.2
MLQPAPAQSANAKSATGHASVCTGAAKRVRCPPRLEKKGAWQQVAGNGCGTGGDRATRAGDISAVSSWAGSPRCTQPKRDVAAQKSTCTVVEKIASCAPAGYASMQRYGRFPCSPGRRSRR